ncbi:hypothetical protein [Kitasatospora sp. NPDC059673]|uniref:hypothetical protein n=1 Tax=Kitasatospora sp. NPDC059673 TaxID=3346901 RepID=UPI0036B4183E
MYTAPTAPAPQIAGGQPLPPRPSYPPFVPPGHTQPPAAPAAPAGVLPRPVLRTRITLIVTAVLNLVLAAVALLQAQALRDSLARYHDAWFAAASGQGQAAQAGVEFAQLALVWVGLHAVVAIVLALRIDKGRSALRSAMVAFGGWQCLMGVLALAVSGSATGGGAVVRALATAAGGALVAYLATRPDAVAWFNRPRH